MRDIARTLPPIALGLALVLAGCGSQRQEAQGGAGPDGTGYVRARTIQQLMADVVQPTADIYWRSVQYISDEEGEHDIRPQTDEDWLAARTAAASLSEFGNLLMTPLYAEGRGNDWSDFARGLVEIGQQAEQAAIEQDPDAVFEMGGNVYNVCRGCHQLYPPAAGVEGETGVRPESDLSLEEYQEQTGE